MLIDNISQALVNLNGMFYNASMGLISYFKSKFGKDIALRGDISAHLVFPYKLKQGKIWLGSKCKVPEEFSFVIGKSGKVLDYFEGGDVELKAIYLPLCVKRFHLDRQQKDGTLANSFACDAYFVNHHMFEYEKWKTYRKIEMFDEKYGYYSFALQGAFAFKVEDAKKFMTALLKVYDYLKVHEAIEILEGFVSEFVLKFFEKKKFSYDEIKNTDYITDKMYESMAKQFMDIGIDIVGFVIEKIKFSRGFEKHIKNVLLEENQFATQKEEVKNVPVQNDFGTPKEQVNQTYFTTQPATEDEIVDLDVISSYNNEAQLTRCKFCGAKNPPENETCKLCGETLKKKV